MMLDSSLPPDVCRRAYVLCLEQSSNLKKIVYVYFICSILQIIIGTEDMICRLRLILLYETPLAFYK
jgi:hypothetical protein